ncbi:hypothetical protein HAZT_HAZT009650 [Hyalella azteca]|uniref:G-protein coupled receptors family 1 profile domain-containing protein n=1 Tax=Hyalella azteca TaxID=294128 RepID=A0A6A0HDP4_HYAAZ|nr:hypothetical protein HAZT_HAZT009650 [Hyalella azteca]
MQHTNDTEGLDPLWLKSYLHCVSLMSDTLNISVSEDVWLAMISVNFNSASSGGSSNSLPNDNAYDTPIPRIDTGNDINDLRYVSHPSILNDDTSVPALDLIPPEGAHVLAVVSSYCVSKLIPQDRPFLLPWWQQTLWTLVFGVMLAAAIGGNALVMWIVCDGEVK